MAMQWILTWARTAFISISRKNIPPPLEHAAFDSQTEATILPSLQSSNKCTRNVKRTNKSAGPRQSAGAEKETRRR